MNSWISTNFYLLSSKQLLQCLVSMCLATLLFTASTAHSSTFTPPQNLNPGQSSTPRLSSSYTEEAWLVYTYNIDTQGVVIDATIHSSNGVTAVEDSILRQLNAMRFRPAMRDTQPVKVAAGPVVFTWILDQTREMSPAFDSDYQAAWAHFKLEEYDQAFDYAAKLKNMAGRNAFEDVKFQILAASLASRWDDQAAELQHLSRIVQFQSLADRNRFDNAYVEEQQYLLILERIHSLQLDKMMLADAAVTLNTMERRDSSSAVAQRTKINHDNADRNFNANPDVAIAAELTPLYRKGPGSWEVRLSRTTFSLSDVKGSIDSVLLSCLGGERQLNYPSRDPWVTPMGWNSCKLEVSGKAGTRFSVHQLTSGIPG